MLPDLDGFEVIRLLREGGARTPVVFLTARDATEDKIRGLTLGGDDYVTKPFSLEELTARIRAVLRRTTPATQAPSRLTFADLELDEETHEVHRAGQRVQLSPTEFKLLRYLMLNASRVLSKAQILDHVWNYDFRGDDNIVESYISYLRRKVDTVRAAADPHPARRRATSCASRRRERRSTVRLRRIRSVPLRVKLVAAVLALVAVALLVISVADAPASCAAT